MDDTPDQSSGKTYLATFDANTWFRVEIKGDQPKPVFEQTEAGNSSKGYIVVRGQILAS
jgi:hypothetical protein